MAKFEIKALNKEGQPYEAVIEATDRATLYGIIRAEGGQVLSVKEPGKNPVDIFMEKLNALFGGVKMQEKINFARNLSAMLSAGLALSRAISVMERQTKNAKLKEILRDINAEIGKGSTFSAGLQKQDKVFPSLFIAMVRAGEESGGLASTLGTIASQMEKSHQLMKKVRGAMIYPAVIIFAMVVIAILMMVFVVPSLTATYKELNVSLPKSTQFIIDLSNFLQNHTILFISLSVGVVALLWSALQTSGGKRAVDYSVTRIPIIGNIVKETNSARTARTLSSLLSAGVEVVQSLSITREVVQNSYYKEIIAEAEKAVEKGVAMSEVFLKHENLYPVLVGEMMSVGEETGAVSDMLEKLATYYETEVDQKTKDMSTIIEPFLMIFIGVGVGFFAIAMISPTYSLVNAI